VRPVNVVRFTHGRSDRILVAVFNATTGETDLAGMMPQGLGTTGQNHLQAGCDLCDGVED